MPPTLAWRRTFFRSPAKSAKTCPTSETSLTQRQHLFQPSRESGEFLRAAHVEHLRTTGPWADDRRGDSNVETERPQRECHDERSESPKGRSGSGVTTDQRTARDGADMMTVLRNLGASLSEMQITDLTVNTLKKTPECPVTFLKVRALEQR